MKNRTDRGFANQLNDLPYLLPTPTTIDGKPVDVKNQMATRNSPGLQCIPALLGMPEDTWPETDMTGNAARQVGESERRRALLPTPRTTDTGGPGIHGNGGQDLRTEVSLPPTPDAYAGTRGGTQRPEKRRAGGHAVSVADVVEHELLPTPKASDGPNGGPNMRGSSGDLSMPSVVHQADFGKYAGAIARWAKVLGRPAPEPTEPGTKPGKRRLSALFVEWMMGQPEGRVTDPELGLSRTQQIKALGNGVVTQQAEIALGRLMERMPR